MSSSSVLADLPIELTCEYRYAMLRSAVDIFLRHGDRAWLAKDRAWLAKDRARLRFLDTARAVSDACAAAAIAERRRRA